MDAPASSLLSFVSSPSNQSSDETRSGNDQKINHLSIKNVCVSAKQGSLLKKLGFVSASKRTTILNNITAKFKSYQMVALMGPSGSGKTTLLNTLNSNLPSNMKFSGKIRFNDKKINIHKVSAYIQQVTLFYEQFTVKEHLNFYIKLNRNRHTKSKLSDADLLDELVNTFSLKKCLNNKIGNEQVEGGLSGGERKRLCIASEIIKLPSIIFADEPTTGLDSHMAASVVSSLKTLANSGVLVIVTIHQPSSDVFKLFDEVCLLSAGRLITCTKIINITRIFKLAGLPCPDKCNPADHMIKTTAMIPGKEKVCTEKINKVKAVAESFTQCFDNTSGFRVKRSSKRHSFSTTYKSSFCTQLWQITLRDLKSIVRDPLSLTARILQNAIITIVAGILFYDIPFISTRFVSIISSTFIMTLISTFSNIFGVINSFPIELGIFKREYNNMMYSPTSYFFAKLVSEIPFTIIINISFASFFYYLIGFNFNAETFLWTLFIIFLITEIEVSFAYCVSTVTADIKVATMLGLSLTAIFLILGGILVPQSTIPTALKFISYLSWFKYSVESISILQLENRRLQCDNKKIAYCNENDTIDGTFGFKTFSFDTKNFNRNIIVLSAILVVFRLISYIALVIRAKKS